MPMRGAAVVKSLDAVAVLVTFVWLIQSKTWEAAAALAALVAGLVGTLFATRRRLDKGGSSTRDPLAGRPDLVVNSYIERGGRIDVVEGTLTVDTLTWGAKVLLPPSAEPAVITFGS